MTRTRRPSASVVIEAPRDPARASRPLGPRNPVKLMPIDPGYPLLLNRWLRDPPTMTVSGPLDPDARRIAIVGARDALPGAQDFAHRLAYHLAKAGITIVSGGAVGIDRCAHEGARRAGGSTWVVACTGLEAPPYPLAHADFFAAIARDDRSRMIWPFGDGTPISAKTPRIRNGVLVALSECVVVVQARNRSGSLSAANWGFSFGKPVYVVPGAPWDYAFSGSIRSGVAGGRALWSIDWFFAQLGLPAPDLQDPAAAWNDTRHTSTRDVRPRQAGTRILGTPVSPLDQASWTSEEKLVFSVLSPGPTQQDDIIAKTGLGTSSTLTALLTLSLKDVVVEGPDGFFRRLTAP